MGLDHLNRPLHRSPSNSSADTTPRRHSNPRAPHSSKSTTDLTRLHKRFSNLNPDAPPSHLRAVHPRVMPHPTAHLPFRTFPSAPFLPAFTSPKAKPLTRQNTSPPISSLSPPSPTIVAHTPPVSVTTMHKTSTIPIANAAQGPHHPHQLAHHARTASEHAREAEADAQAAANAARARLLNVPQSPNALRRRLAEMRAMHGRQVDALRGQHAMLGVEDGVREAQVRGLMDALGREERVLVDASARILGEVAFRVAGYVGGVGDEFGATATAAQEGHVGGLEMRREGAGAGA
ncbi:hypothetical protein HK101_007015, partial [Irineochytrium annulatum]